MSLAEKANIVAQIALKNNTYYVTDRDGGILLDGNTYEPVVIEWGDVPHTGNLGDGQFQVAAMAMKLVNGEEFEGYGYKYDITDVWNNYQVTAKRYIDDIHFRFVDCLDYTTGIIKNFQSNNNEINFSVEGTDNRDDQLIPGVLCTDQGNLSDAESKTTFKNWANQDLIEPTDISIFSIGELVKLTAANGDFEFARVKAKETYGAANVLKMWANLTYHTSYAFAYTNTVEKAFRFLPKAFVDKTLPVQIGDLTNTSGGIFAKLATLNEEIGSEVILADYISMQEFNDLGAWESGLRRYFKAQDVNATIEGDQAEYTLVDNMAQFRVDTTTTLTATITDTVEGVSVISVADYTKIMYVNEDDLGTSRNQELISTNIIAVEDELMMIMDRPVNSQVYVERGFNNTPIGTHDAGTAVFQSAKYSARNLLIFTERFMPKMVTNATFLSRSVTGGINVYDIDSDLITNFTQGYVIAADGLGKLSHIKDENILNYEQSYIRLSVEGAVNNPTREYILIFDMLFPKIEDSDFDTIGWYPATKFWLSATSNYVGGAAANVRTNFAVIDPNTASEADANNIVITDEFWFGRAIIDTISTDTSDKDYYSELDRSLDGNYLGLGVGVGTNNSLNYDGGNNTISLTNLTDLNKKWKMLINHRVGANNLGESGICQSKIYNVGFWVDFFIDFTEKVVMGSVQGREITADVTDVVGGASPDTTGDLCENPVDVCALLLTQELKYLTDAVVAGQTEFTSNWETVHDYVEDSGNYEISSPASPTPETAFSYGMGDERKKGWEFVSWVASHFNLQITKTYAGKIDIVNLHQIYNSTPTGNEIKIEDILFLVGSGNRRITVHQTGTDLIYNDIVVKYKRNNSTDEYQETYILPDSYALVKSGDTLATARDNYYNGEKRNLTVESPFIYNLQDAQRLAEWKANDQSEVHFYVDLFVDWMHYSDINSLSSQYAVGDMIYLTGDHSGVTFTVDRKFYIQNIIFTDSGRECQIQAKSVDPVSSF